jgi:hypothetical protein
MGGPAYLRRPRPFGDDLRTKRKVPPCGGTFLLSLRSSIRISGRPCPVGGRGFGPDDWGLAVAVRAFGRRPAADRASDWGSGSAGPVSGRGWTSGSPWLNLAGHNPGRTDWLHGTSLFRDYSGAAACRDYGRGNRGGSNLPMYKPLRRSLRCCRAGFPLLEKPPSSKTLKTRRAGCRGRRRVSQFLGHGSAWIISPSNSSTGSCSARSTA